MSNILKGINEDKKDPRYDYKYWDQMTSAEKMKSANLGRGVTVYNEKTRKYSTQFPVEKKKAVDVKIENDNWYEVNPRTFDVVKEFEPDSYSAEFGKDEIKLPNGNLVVRGTTLKNKQGINEGPETDNFSIDDIHELEKIRDLATIKARAKELVKGKPVKRMKPEKIAYFYDRIDTLTSPVKVIKLMYDLLLAGEGLKTIGSKFSMDPNTYQKRFSEDIDDTSKEKIKIADNLYTMLEYRYPDVVTRFGHEVVGDAILDVVDLYAGRSTPESLDYKSLVKIVIKKLENYNQDINESFANIKRSQINDDDWYEIDREGKIIKQSGPSAYTSSFFTPVIELPNGNILARGLTAKLQKLIKFNEPMNEDLRKWFKEKWVRFGPDGKIRGACARGDDSEGKPKCLPQAKAHALGKKGRKYAASKKRREDPNPERRGPAKNVATKKKTDEGMAEEQLDELKCWPGYTRVKGVPAGAPGSCKKKTNEESDEQLDEKWSEKYKRSIDCSNPKGFSQRAHCQGRKKHDESVEHKCPHCGGELVSEELINEKKDACYYKVKSRYKVWPSAYASGALVQCRKKGAKNWGTKTNEDIVETKSAILKGIKTNESK